MKKRWIAVVVSLVISLCLGSTDAIDAMGGTDTVDTMGGKTKRAEARIQGCTNSDITGIAKLKERTSDEGVKLVDVHIKIKGLSEGKHAVHVHETGECDPCGAAKGHFDPGPHGFSNPDGNHPFHSGDLVNIKSKGGTGVMETTTSRITLSPGPLSIFDEDGSAFIIHTNMDTYCPEGVVSGCAGGPRDACGVIKMVKDRD